MQGSGDCVSTSVSVDGDLFRVQMVSPVLEASKVCSARKEMKAPEDSLDLLVQLGCRWVDPKHINALCICNQERT